MPTRKDLRGDEIPDSEYFVVLSMGNSALHEPHPQATAEDPAPRCPKRGEQRRWSLRHHSHFVGLSDPCEYCFPEWSE